MKDQLDFNLVYVIQDDLTDNFINFRMELLLKLASTEYFISDEKVEAEGHITSNLEYKIYYFFYSFVF